MLKVLRDNLKYLSWILWVVILIFIAFVFVDFGGGLAGGAGGRQAAATFGDESISYTDFQREYRRLEAQYRQAFGDNFTPELANQLKLPLQALDRLVDQRLLLDEAKARGLDATDREVRETILEFPGMKDESGAFIGEETYQRFVRANGYTVRDFERAVRDEIRLNKLNRIFSASVAVSDAEVEKSYRDQADRAGIRYVVLPAARFTAEAQPTPAEMAAYFAAHKEEFRLPLVLSLPSGATLGEEQTSVEFVVDADRQYRFRIERPYQVGLGDIEIDRIQANDTTGEFLADRRELKQRIRHCRVPRMAWSC